MIFEIAAQDTLALRQAVLWPDKLLHDLAVPGDDTALHLGAHHQGDIVGVASFFPDGDTARLRKLAVRPDMQGHGLGRALIDAGAAVLAERGVHSLWCDARMSASGFYQTLGFQLENDTFFKGDIPYCKASRALNAVTTRP